jgi:voltage-gated potassium channel Kch
MFATQLIIGALMISASVIFHVAALIFLIGLWKKFLARMARLRKVARIILVMIFNVLVVIGVHTVEAWSWAALYLYLGEFSDLQHALYFSVVTATTLGYGDVTLSPDWQILSTFEAMGGLILFGVSTAFLLELMRRLFTE